MFTTQFVKELRMKNKLFCCTLAMIVALACLSTQVWGAQKTDPKKVVVMNFKTRGCSPELGAATSVAFRGLLAGLDQDTYQFEERQVLNDFLSSYGLALTAPLNRKASKKAARKLDADYFIDGELSSKGKAYTLVTRLVDAPTRARVRTYTIRASSVQELLQKLPEIGLAILDLSMIIKHGHTDPMHKPADHLEYASWYSDGKGIHRGGKIILNIKDDTVNGISIESYGRASMEGKIQGDRIIGVYRASYGWGNFEFTVQDQWKKLKGEYYQVSNGASGEWSGMLR